MSFNPFTLEGKTVLVTGASSGIGKATAILCSQMGAKLAITARNPERLEGTFKSLEGMERGHVQIIADISTDVGLESLVTQLPELDGVASNAGVVMTLPIQFYTRAKIGDVFGTNIIAPMLLIKTLLKFKKLRKSSSIVFTSSAGGVYGSTIANGIYDASKCALSGFLRVAALELASRRIRCNSVNPGMVDTPMTALSAITEEQLAADRKRYPLGRYGKPADIANAIVYLLSDASSWVTGTELKIDGGITI